MKRILGLDLGTNSIGWALVEEEENNHESPEIIKLGVRVIQYDNFSKIDRKSGKVSESKNPVEDFKGGKGLSPNASRTKKRTARRNLQRFILRREHLHTLLLEEGVIDADFILAENGKNTTHQTLKIRARAAREKIGLEDLARVFFAINKKRGYKSSRKTKDENDGVAVDGMAVAKHLYDNQLTPGQYALELLEKGKKHIPDFYRSDLQEEFNAVWERQKQFYPDILTQELYAQLQNKNKSQTWDIFQEPSGIEGITLEGRPAEQKVLRYQLRAKGISEKLELEHLAIVLQEINNDKNKSSGHLGNISDRSKILYMDKKTVGEYLWGQLAKSPHTSLKNQVFYRQDYLDEFERIWETQAKHYVVLTPKLKDAIRDTIIFYQRKLKSKKGEIGFCQFESWEEVRRDEQGRPVLNKSTGVPKKRTVGHRIVPKSSPLFQEFKIWQNLNNLEFTHSETKENMVISEQEDEVRQELFEELNLRGNLTPNGILKILSRHFKIGKTSLWKCNFEEIQGNRTNQAFYNAYQTIMEREGYGFDWAKKSAKQIKYELLTVFPTIGIDSNILDFNAGLDGDTFDKQPSYQLWHLLYSAEDDHKIGEEDRLLYGNSDVNLKKKLGEKFGFAPKYAPLVSGISLPDDYGNLSARAIRKILPFMQDGNDYAEACALAGYNHSNSLTKKELKERELKERLELLPKNSLRNPVVEKILNQMVNLINQVCDEYGKPDEIRIELARELKKSAKERKEAKQGIAKATKKNEEIKALILDKFGFTATRNDVIRYRLWQELGKNGHKTLFSNECIPPQKLFSKDIDIEHIIPKALLFDDSFSNKTLAYKKINLQKRDRTALDFMEQDHNADLERYKQRVEMLHKDGAISTGKYKKLLTSAKNLPDGFIERDLRNSQYIAKRAKAMLKEVFRTVVPTTGSITDKLREDWDLINVMKELNLPKYRALGLTEIEKRWDSGQEKEKGVEVIRDWTKRNDHRHHAMDALTVAFTSYNHIQYINYMNARRDEAHKEHKNIVAIENIIKKDGKFLPPMPQFRTKAKKHIASVLVSFKTKNKVVTRNINKTRAKRGETIQKPLTPRGQLHRETVYGKSKQPMDKPIRINKRLYMEQVENIINPKVKRVVLDHLEKFNNTISIAFDTKTLKKEPLTFNGEDLKTLHCYETVYTIRKDVNPDNFNNEKSLEKIIDNKVRQILKARLASYNNDPKAAFSNLDKNPIWLNEAKGISIKRASITGVSNVEALHEKRDHFGAVILDKNGKPVQSDYVSTGNNHHVAIYRDENGMLQEKVTSFFEAVQRVNNDLPALDREHNSHLGWKFLFTMKQNEMFVFPNEDFNLDGIDLLDVKNAMLISKHLFRVQKISTKNYLFTHHLETQATTGDDLKKLKMLSSKKYFFVQTPDKLDGIVKVRIDNLGRIVSVGEY